MLFYRTLLMAAFELAPDETMRAITDVVATFQMPGHGIQNFAYKSMQIAIAGIYDLRIHHDEVLTPILRRLNVFGRVDLAGEGERAREELAGFWPSSAGERPALRRGVHSASMVLLLLPCRAFSGAVLRRGLLRLRLPSGLRLLLALLPDRIMFRLSSTLEY